MKNPEPPTTITPISVELYTPATTTPLEMVKHRLSYILRDGRADLARFAERVATAKTDPMSAFSYGDDALRAAASVERHERIQHCLNSVIAGKITGREALRYLDKEAARRMEDGLDHNSTSEMSNVADRFLGKEWSSWNGRFSSGVTRKMFAKAVAELDGRTE